MYMEEVVMTASLITLIIGSFVVWNVIVRYKTINSLSFIRNTQVTVFIFTSFAVGSSILNLEKTTKITQMLIEYETFRFYLFASPCLIPIIFKIVKGNKFSSAITFDIELIALPFALFFALKYFLLPHNKDLFLVIYFTIFVATLGFIHSTLGSILASFNIALIVANYLNKNIITVNLNNIFDLFDYIGVVSPVAKWIMLFASTTVAIHSCMNTQWLKDFLNAHFSHS